MTGDKVRVIKIGKEAIYEYIREKIMDDLEDFFDVDALKTTRMGEAISRRKEKTIIYQAKTIT